ncbi:MAG: hypothetical protein JRI46_06390 [Deltaproteobacteria bacterium]|nr:hypothetical protein [Deltaproteobacteria bacterium]
MISISPQEFEVLLPLACAWAQEQERLILEKGVELTDDQMADARSIGVTFPERVRLLEVKQIPMPEHPGLRAAAQETGLISPEAAGLTLRHGIYIRSYSWDVRSLVAHELVHVKQYEQLGGFTPFLRKYLWECLTIGYPDAPMEQEARSIEEKFYTYSL